MSRRQTLDVFLDGVSLNGFSSRIKVTDIIEEEPNYTLSKETNSIGYGSVVTKNQRDMISVTVRFLVLIHDVHERMNVLDAIRGWCKSGVLSVSTKPGRILHVMPSKHPTSGSASYSDVFDMTFTAYETPWWESSMPTLATITGGSTAQMYVDGNAEETVCDLHLTNTGNTSIDEMEVSIAGSHFAFDSLNLAAGATLHCVHDRGLLNIYTQAANGTVASAYSKRTPESDDELIARCAAFNTVTLTASAALTGTIEARGRWM